MFDAKCNRAHVFEGFINDPKQFYCSCVTDERELSDHLSPTTAKHLLKMWTKFVYKAAKVCNILFRVKRMEEKIYFGADHTMKVAIVLYLWE